MCTGMCSVLGFVLISVVQCSSVLTRSMIRMPDPLQSSSTRNRSPKEGLSEVIPKPRDGNYQIVYPVIHSPMPSKSGESRSLNIDTKSIDNTDVLNETKDFSKTKTDTVLSNYSDFSKSTPIPGEEQFQKHHSNEELDNILEITKTERGLETYPSPKEFSSKYWEQYKNFSNEHFQNNKKLFETTDLSAEKRQQQITIWEVLQNMINCQRSSGWISCAQDILGDSISLDTFPVLQVLAPILSRQLQEEEPADDFEYNNDKFDLLHPDLDEGRRKVSKKLQQLLPFLLALKMTMLPSLAIMALVAGKAFLMSLLSLGVALVATFAQTQGLSANKRQEIASQSTIPVDNPNSNYYYMM